jgi:hypothetical protein
MRPQHHRTCFSLGRHTGFFQPREGRTRNFELDREAQSNPRCIPNESRVPSSNCPHFPDAQPAPGQVRPGFGVGHATFELPTFSRRTSLHLAKYDQDRAWEMPRSNCTNIPDCPAKSWPSTTRIRRGRCHVRIAHIFLTDQPAPGQVRPGVGVGNATIELPTFPDCPACTWPSTTRIWLGRCHVRIANIFPTAQPEPGQERPRSGMGVPRSNCPHFPTPSLHLAEYDQDLAWDMPRLNCPKRHGKTHQQAWDSVLGRWGGAPWRAFLTHRGAWAGRQVPPIIG